MSFRDYAQVIPIVKWIGIIPRSEPATEAEKKLGKNFIQQAQKIALILDVRTLQQIINQNTRYRITFILIAGHFEGETSFEQAQYKITSRHLPWPQHTLIYQK